MLMRIDGFDVTFVTRDTNRSLFVTGRVAANLSQNLGISLLRQNNPDFWKSEETRDFVTV